MSKPGHHFPSELGFTGSARGFAKGGAVKAALKRHLMKSASEAHPDPKAAAALAKGGPVRLRERPAQGDYITSAPPVSPLASIKKRFK